MKDQPHVCCWTQVASGLLGVVVFAIIALYMGWGVPRP